MFEAGFANARPRPFVVSLSNHTSGMRQYVVMPEDAGIQRG